MNEDKDKLDDLFRRGLEDPVDQTSYQETDWDSLEQMLDKHKKRRGIIYWLPVLSAAAVLLLFLGWWFLVPKASQHNQAQNQVASHVKQPKAGAEDIIKPKPAQRMALPDGSNYADNGNHRNVSKGSKPLFTSSAAGRTRDNAIDIPADATTGRLPGENLMAVSYLSVGEQASIVTSQVNSFDIPRPSISPATGTDVPKPINKTKLQSAFRPQFAITVLAAPDLNGVGSFQQSKLGTNVGLLFSAGVSKKFTISTGLIYSDKPYLTDFASYHTAYKFPTDPLNVTADCRMLDIPLNLGYQLYNKRRNKISIGTGLSSYIMLNQSFKFNYANSYVYGPSHFDVPGNYKYLFSVLNLNATYQRQLSSKVGLTVQPYLKLPMADIGYSQVRLQTTGIAVGLSWNLNSLTKR